MAVPYPIIDPQGALETVPTAYYWTSRSVIGGPTAYHWTSRSMTGGLTNYYLDLKVPTQLSELILWVNELIVLGSRTYTFG